MFFTGSKEHNGNLQYMFHKSSQEDEKFEPNQSH